MLIFFSNVSDNAHPLGQSNESRGDTRVCYPVAVVSKKTPVKFVGEGDVGDVGVVSVESEADSSVGGRRVDVLRKKCGDYRG